MGDTNIKTQIMNVKHSRWTIDPCYKGEASMGVFVKKSKGITSWTRIWGGWNRRFLTINLNNMKIAYSKAPLSKTKTTIDIEEINWIRKDPSQTQNGLCFTILTPRREFTFECESMLQLDLLCKCVYAIVDVNTGKRLYTGRDITFTSEPKCTSLLGQLPANKKL